PLPLRRRRWPARGEVARYLSLDERAGADLAHDESLVEQLIEGIENRQPRNPELGREGSGRRKALTGAERPRKDRRAIRLVNLSEKGNLGPVELDVRLLGGGDRELQVVIQKYFSVGVRRVPCQPAASRDARVAGSSTRIAVCAHAMGSQ